MSRSRAGFFASITSILRPDEPIKRLPTETAAVAIVAKETGDRVELLLIRRSERRGDPWSGQVALPGGRVRATDSSFRETAIRETKEEVGVELREAKFGGYLTAFQAYTRSIWVVPSVFVVDSEVAVKPNEEVASYRWVALDELLSDSKRTRYTIEWDGRRRTFPAFDLDGYLVWGLTERILSAVADTVRQSRQRRAGAAS